MLKKHQSNQIIQVWSRNSFVLLLIVFNFILLLKTSFSPSSTNVERTASSPGSSSYTGSERDAYSYAQAMPEAELRSNFEPRQQKQELPPPHDPSNDARNNTLGFSKIFVISLKTRTDRQDAIAMLASLTGVTVTYIDASDGSLGPKEMPVKARGILTKPEIGCWRSHANVWKRILDEDLESALILEDDVDWDIYMKDIMQQLSKEMRSDGFTQKMRVLDDQRWTDDERARAPYGLDWDVLALGQWSVDHHAPPGTGMLDLTHFYSDYNINTNYPALGSHGRQVTWALEQFGYGDYETGNWRQHQHRILNIPENEQVPIPRMIIPLRSFLGLFCYAVSKKGAQKLLFEVTMNMPAINAVDNLILIMNNQGKLRGYSVLPPVASYWETASIRDSNIRVWHADGEDEVLPTRGYQKHGLKYSLRSNMRNMLFGWDKFRGSTRVLEKNPDGDEGCNSYWDRVIETRKQITLKEEYAYGSPYMSNKWAWFWEPYYKVICMKQEHK